MLSGLVLDDPLLAPEAIAEPLAPKAEPARAEPKAEPKAKPKAQPKVEAKVEPKAKVKGVQKDLSKAVGQRTLPSGLRYEVLQRGTGPQAAVGKKVKVRYEGRLGTTGARFDKGVIDFRLGMGEVIQGWDQGVRLG